VVAGRIAQRRRCTLGKRWSIGIDFDGVLASFTYCFTATMRELFPGRGLWAFSEDGQEDWKYENIPGITKEIVNATWEHILASRNWWVTLPKIPTPAELYRLKTLSQIHDTYILTNRVGQGLLDQCFTWLHAHGLGSTSVIITRKKGEFAKLLGLDFYLDDHPGNCVDVAYLSEAKAFVRDQPYNRFLNNHKITRVYSLGEYLDAIEAEVNHA